MSLESIRQNARSMIEIIENYEKLVKQQYFLVEKNEEASRINELNEKILQLKLYFLKLLTSTDQLVKQEEQLLGNVAR